MVNFCQHSEYSYFGSLLRLKDLIHFNAFQGYSACSLTDTLSTYGYYELTRTCRQRNIQPIYGITLFSNGVSGKGCYPIVLIANNNIGLSNIFKLNTLSHMKFEQEMNFRLSLNDLEQHKEGISFIAESELNAHAENYSYLTQYFEKMKDLFGDHFYININYTGLPKVDCIKQNLALIKHYNVPGLANIEARYHHPDQSTFGYLNAMRLKYFKDDERGYELDARMDYSIRTQQEFQHLFSHHPYLLENNRRLLESIDTRLDWDSYSREDDEHSYKKLKRICELKLLEIKPDSDRYKERLEKELEQISRKKMLDYFLFLHEILQLVHREQITLSPGYGNNISSLVSYLLNHHSIDPMTHPLLEYSFRNHFPHFTLDSGWKDKHRILDMIIKRYSNQQVSHISSVKHMLGRTVIRNLAQVYPISSEELEKLWQFFPSYQKGDAKLIRTKMRKSIGLQHMVSENPIYREFLSICSRIEGLPSGYHAHSDMILVLPQGIDKIASQEYYQNKQFTAQLQAGDIQQSPLLHFSIRGQRTSSVLYQISRIKPYREIDLSDTKSWDNLQKWNRHSIPDLEMAYAKSLLKKQGPENIEELADIFALQHNLTLQKNEKVNHYLNRKNKLESWSSHPFLEEILRDTEGIFLYQEQLHRLFSKIKGWTETLENEFLQAIHDQDDESIPRFRQELQTSLQQEGIEEKESAALCALILEESGSLYPYYQSISQAYHTYTMVYYWTHFKREYYLNSLNNAIGYPVRLNDLISEARSESIEVDGLHINSSNVYFTPYHKGLITGLIVIKYLNTQLCQDIVNLRRNRPFKDMVDFLVRTQDLRLSNRQIENLIKSGCFRFDIPSIRTALAVYPVIRDWIKDHDIKTEEEVSEYGLFDNNPEQSLPGTKVFISESAHNDDEDDQNFIRSATELFLDKHPVHRFSEDLRKMDIDNLSHLHHLNYVVCAVYLYRLRVTQTRDQKDMAFASISDPSGLAEAVFFPGKYKKYIHVIKEKELFLIKGKTDENKILVDEIYRLDKIL